MAKMNRIEAEVDAIRDILYEKTKHLTAAEHTRWANERAHRLAAQYGFKIGKPSSKVSDKYNHRKQIDGHWEGVFTTGRDSINGRNIRKSVYGKSQCYGSFNENSFTYLLKQIHMSSRRGQNKDKLIVKSLVNQHPVTYTSDMALAITLIISSEWMVTITGR